MSSNSEYEQQGYWDISMGSDAFKQAKEFWEKQLSKKRKLSEKIPKLDPMVTKPKQVNK
jgi:hypothetical protein